jgi:tungstate transport system substrate-binding protein
MRYQSFLLTLAFFFLLLGCSDREQPGPKLRSLRVATTTSVDGTGLMAQLVDPFSEMTGVKVSVIAVGSGHAMKLAREGEVDLVLVHSPAAEEVFIREGYGLNRRQLMHNDFVLVGPPNDPCKLRSANDLDAAIELLVNNECPFVSRGDDSGTHKKELSIWSGVLQARPTWSGYIESGQGQRLTLEMANQRQAYCLLDRATFLYAAKAVDLEILWEEPQLWNNQYSVIPVSPQTHRGTHYLEAMLFVGWLTSPQGQDIIRDFQLAGRPAFFPDAVNTNAD